MAVPNKKSQVKKLLLLLIFFNINLNHALSLTLKLRHLLKIINFISKIMLLCQAQKWQSKYLIKLIHVPVQIGVKSKFKWIMQNKWTYPISIKDLPPQNIQKRSFQQKVRWFRLRLQDRKVSWTNGCDNIFVDRTNILISSYEQLSKLNITKEIKVNFTDEKGQNDAGGIFREWLNLCMKQICQNKFGLLKLCQTQDTYYKFNLNDQIISQCLNNAKLLGYLIAKALMERVPLNCHLNHTIWRQILQQRIILDDICSYDQDFYKHWKSILNNQGIASALCINFTAEVKNDLTGRIKVYDLIKGGRNIFVTQNNKEQYITKMIQFYCIKFTAQAIKSIKMTLFEIIPFRDLAVFQPHQIDCLLCGQDVIDVQDWKENTLYEGYTKDDQIIEWFWKVMFGLDKSMLKNMLHYCTGCSRVPVTGFKFLQSNRGQIKKFTIRKASYEAGNPYPKSYTCFNRLQLPEYQTFEELQMRVYNISSYQINQINMEA